MLINEVKAIDLPVIPAPEDGPGFSVWPPGLRQVCPLDHRGVVVLSVNMKSFGFLILEAMQVYESRKFEPVETIPQCYLQAHPT
ncbi:Uncharacterized protein HZ326_1435 [Fusarium oxysporum f. sp. albedinis]|nr:Uncharacterized protein HZ326_1435 [Fusarium oxysporum f. sp. albedinis]